MADIVIKVEGALDINEAAKELGIGYATIYRWIKRNLIRPVDARNVPQQSLSRTTTGYLVMTWLRRSLC